MCKKDDIMCYSKKLFLAITPERGLNKNLRSFSRWNHHIEDNNGWILVISEEQWKCIFLKSGLEDNSYWDV